MITISSTNVEALVEAILNDLGTEQPEHYEHPQDRTLRSLALAIKAEMEAEEEAFCAHLEEMYDGWQFTMDCALEGQIGAWVLGK